MRQWVNYINGNYTVSLNIADGTKIRTCTSNIFKPATIENVELKITNYCTGTEGKFGTNKGGCPFCCEKSSPFGKHGNILDVPFLNKLHPYCELTLSGGNPFAHPDLLCFLEKCRQRYHIPNITVNQVYFEKYFEKIKKLTAEKLIFKVAVSLVKVTDEFIEKIKQLPNASVVIINGIATEEDIQGLCGKGLKISVLGYREFKRGKDFYVNNLEKIKCNQLNLKNKLLSFVDKTEFEKIYFDHLAVE